MHIYIFDKNGQCLCRASKNYVNLEDIHEDITATMESLEGDHYIESGEVYNRSKIKSNGEVIVLLTEKPEGNYKYDYINNDWVIDKDGEYAIQRKKALVLLRASDYTQYPDVQEDMSDEDKLKWKMYRKKLRDFPKNYDELQSYEWPEKPQ